MNAIHPNLSQRDFGQLPLALSRRHRLPLITGLSLVAAVFAGVLIAYLVIRAGIKFSMPPLPWIFWPSTIVLVGATIVLQYAVSYARRCDGSRAHRSLLTATALSFLFVGLQAPGIVMLGQLHTPFNVISPMLYGLTLALVGLHLLLFVGAVAVLAEASLESEKHHYEARESRFLWPVSIYCQVLTVIWLFVLATLVLVNL